MINELINGTLSIEVKDQTFVSQYTRDMRKLIVTLSVLSADCVSQINSAGMVLISAHCSTCHELHAVCEVLHGATYL